MTEKTIVSDKKKKVPVRTIVLCGFFAALIAIGAFIQIPIPLLSFSLQTMFVSLAGMLLGRKAGVVSVLIYIAVGLAGLPIFSRGGGPGYVLTPSFGFLIGFVLYTYFTGYFTEKLKALTMKNLILAQLPGLFLMYAVALPYYYMISVLYLNTEIGVSVLLLQCFVWMLPGEMVKCILAAWMGKRLIPVLRKNN